MWNGRTKYIKVDRLEHILKITKGLNNNSFERIMSKPTMEKFIYQLEGVCQNWVAFLEEF